MFFQRRITEEEVALKRRQLVFADQIDLSDEAWPEDTPTIPSDRDKRIGKGGVAVGVLGGIVGYKALTSIKFWFFFMLLIPFWFGVILHRVYWPEGTKLQSVIWGLFTASFLYPLILIKLLMS